ncbi:MAG: hypothetical protein AB7O59_05280 [Pirellulales bacterium]
MAIETPARIAVIGAGPIGLEAALYARYLGYDVDLYERGAIAENVRRWGHVQMFTPFGMNRSPLGLAALRAQDEAWQPPADDAHLTGREFVERYLVPLAHSDLLIDGLHEHTRTDVIGRTGMLPGELAGDEARADSEFRLLVTTTRPGEAPRERFATADAVIDTSGTFGHHGWLGPDGIPALGERAAELHIEYGLPDVLGAARQQYAGRNILLVGDGDTAATNLVALAHLATEVPDTWITWVVRRPCDEHAPEPIAPRDGVASAERQRLANQANRLAADDSNHVTFYSGSAVEAVTWHADLDRFAVRLAGKHTEEIECDRIVASVGGRPDMLLARELQVCYCPVTGAPVALGRALRSQSDFGSAAGDSTWTAEMLVTDEPDYYVLGAKSFGRDSRFTIRHGLEQIRALFTLIGDRPGLDLYATMKGLC